MDAWEFLVSQSSSTEGDAWERMNTLKKGDITEFFVEIEVEMIEVQVDVEEIEVNVEYKELEVSVAMEQEITIDIEV